MWVANSGFFIRCEGKRWGKVYAYNLSTGARDTSKEFDFSVTHIRPRGMWSDGTIMWVADNGPERHRKVLRASDFPPDAATPDEEWLFHSDNGTPRGHVVRRDDDVGGRRP